MEEDYYQVVTNLGNLDQKFPLTNIGGAYNRANSLKKNTSALVGSFVAIKKVVNQPFAVEQSEIVFIEYYVNTEEKGHHWSSTPQGSIYGISNVFADGTDILFDIKEYPTLEDVSDEDDLNIMVSPLEVALIRFTEISNKRIFSKPKVGPYWFSSMAELDELLNRLIKTRINNAKEVIESLESTLRSKPLKEKEFFEEYFRRLHRMPFLHNNEKPYMHFLFDFDFINLDYRGSLINANCYEKLTEEGVPAYFFSGRETDLIPETKVLVEDFNGLLTNGSVFYENIMANRQKTRSYNLVLDKEIFTTTEMVLEEMESFQSKIREGLVKELNDIRQKLYLLENMPPFSLVNIE